jgi:hypothetical protein
MATQDDVRRIALSLPETTEGADDFGFGVLNKGKLKGFVWAWNERIEPGKPRVPNPEVLVVRVAGQRAKEELLAADPDKFFTEPHYNGFPAVLVRLPAIDTDELAELITDAWRCQAPRALAAELDNPPRLGHGEAAVGTADDFQSIETTGVDVCRYDKAAIVRCAQRSRSSWRGEAMSIAVRLSQVWVWQSGRRQLAGIQFSSLGPEG